MNSKTADVFGQNKHYFDTASFDDLAVGKRVGWIVSFEGRIVNLEAVASLDLEKPCARVGIVVNDSRLAGVDFAWTEVNVHVVLVFGIVRGGMGFGISPNIDGESGDKIRPVLGG